MSEEADFWSDEDKKNVSEDGQGNVLSPIVEVSSETSTAASTARSDCTESTLRDDDASDNEDGSSKSEEEKYTARHSARSKKHKKRLKNGKVDLTPPDKLLRHSERKIKKYMKLKRTESALKELIRCIALVRIVHGATDWKLAQAHANLAAAYLDTKAYNSQAQHHAEYARGIMMSNVHPSDSETEKAAIMETLINIYYILGRALTQLKKYSDAEQNLQKAEKISQERAKNTTVSDDDLDDWDTNIYLALAKLNAKKCNQALAQEYFEKTLDIIEDRFGKDSTKLIPIYQGMGMVEQSKGKHCNHEKAIQHFLKAHSVCTSRYKSNSAEVAETARILAAAYSSIGEEDAETSAESYLNECLAIYQALHGPNHSKTIDIQSELAKIMIRTDRQQEGIDMLRENLEAQQQLNGEYSAEAADTMRLMGSLYLSIGNADKSLSLLKRCYSIQALIYGANSKKCKDTQKTIDILLANPALAAKHKEKSELLKERPRFNSVVSRGSSLGGFKSQTF